MADQIVVIHYLYRNPQGAIKLQPVVMANADGKLRLSDGGGYTVACRPERTDLGSHCRTTLEAHLVNCPKCRATEAWQVAPDKVHPSLAKRQIPEELRADS